jgi:hypothetical protein
MARRAEAKTFAVTRAPIAFSILAGYFLLDAATAPFGRKIHRLYSEP